MSSLHLGTFALFILPDTSRCRNNNRSGLQFSIKISAQIGRTSTMKPTFDHFLDFLTSYLRLRKRWSAGLSTAPNLPWRADPMILSRGVSHHCPLSFCRHAVIHSQEIWDKVLQPRLESHQLIPCPLSHQQPPVALPRKKELDSSPTSPTSRLSKKKSVSKSHCPRNSDNATAMRLEKERGS